MGESVGYMGVDLDSRDSQMRRYETNFGNFIADLMRTEYSTDFGLVNGGSFRKNGVIQEGPFSLMTIWESFPFNDVTMVLEMPGSTFKKALEKAVGLWPAEQSLFLQVSNVQFVFNPEKPAGERIEVEDIYCIGMG